MQAASGRAQRSGGAAGELAHARASLPYASIMSAQRGLIDVDRPDAPRRVHAHAPRRAQRCCAQMPKGGAGDAVRGERWALTGSSRGRYNQRHRHRRSRGPRWRVHSRGRHRALAVLDVCRGFTHIVLREEVRQTEMRSNDTPAFLDACTSASNLEAADRAARAAAGWAALAVLSSSWVNELARGGGEPAGTNQCAHFCPLPSPLRAASALLTFTPATAATATARRRCGPNGAVGAARRRLFL